MKTSIKKFIINTLLMAATAGVAVAIGSQLPQLYKKWQGPFKNGDFSAHIKNQNQSLTLYGTTTCPHCESARAYLKKNGIAYNDQILDKSKEAEANFKLLNEKSVPVIVSAHKLLVGFNEQEYDKLINTELKK
ncbi:MAG: glutaredoxin domain-containing protein [Pseudomonadota bacterium]